MHRLLFTTAQAVEANGKPEKRVVESESKPEEKVQRSGGGRTITVHAASTKMEDSPIHKTSVAFEASTLKVDTTPGFLGTFDPVPAPGEQLPRSEAPSSLGARDDATAGPAIVAASEKADVHMEATGAGINPEIEGGGRLFEGKNVEVMQEGEWDENGEEESDRFCKMSETVKILTQLLPFYGQGDDSVDILVKVRVIWRAVTSRCLSPPSHQRRPSRRVRLMLCLRWTWTGRTKTATHPL